MKGANDPPERAEPPRLETAIPGPRSREAMQRLSALECPAFAERRKGRAAASGGDFEPIVLARGHGANVDDVDGNRYVDLAAGFGAAILGHGPSPAHAAAAAQLGVLAQGLGDLYASDVKVALVERLAALLPRGPGEAPARVLLAQSGADAVTAALKTAVLTTGAPGIVAFEGAYHGLSYAPLAACGYRESFRAPFAAQLGEHVRFAPYPRDDASLEASLDRVRAHLAAGGIGAILVEPVLGRGGVIVPPDAFLPELARLARAHDALLVADEIWTGMGRGGHLALTLASGVRPDLLCLGKGLGASLPIAACVGTDAAMAGWARGGEVVHTSTHAGAPLGCAAALATLEALERLALPARAEAVGARVVQALRERLAPIEAVREVRGRGLMIGVELATPALGLAVFAGLLRRGYLTTTGGRGEVVVLTPPLVIDASSLVEVGGRIVEIVEESARIAHGGSGP
jgi:4-aminobutyrate aminotransferase-like enzyme